MASSKVMASPSSRSSDLSRKSSSGSSKPKPQPTPANSVSINPMTVEDFLRHATAAGDSTLVDAQIRLLDASAAIEPAGGVNSSSSNASKTVDEVWREIVSGESNNRSKECKEEASDAVMTLEDFLLAKTGAGAALSEDDEEDDEVDVKNLAFATPPLTERLSGGIFSFDAGSQSSFQALDSVEGSVVGFGNGIEVVGGRGKRGRGVMEPLDKAAQQRQRRMIKNRESAARSRERKQVSLIKWLF